MRAKQEAVRQRAAALFDQGQSASAVARRLGVARQTAVSWQARWRAGGAAALGSRGPSQRPKVLDNQLPAIDAALRQGPAAHGFATTVWTSEQVRVVIEQVTGVQLTPSVVRRLLRERLGWSVQRHERRPRWRPPPPTTRARAKLLAGELDDLNRVGQAERDPLVGTPALD